jgi:hypothetical protein
MERETCGPPVRAGETDIYEFADMYSNLVAMIGDGVQSFISRFWGFPDGGGFSLSRF